MFDTGESEMCFTLNDQNTKFITGQVNKTTEKGKDEDADDYLKMSKKETLVTWLLIALPSKIKVNSVGPRPVNFIFTPPFITK